MISIIQNSTRREILFRPSRALLLALGVLSSIGCLAGPGPAAASPQSSVEPPELVTDRPDQTESAEVVPLGTVQLEIGWLRVRDESREGGRKSRVDTVEAPGTLLRIGAFERLELRFGWAGWLDEQAHAEGLEGGGARRSSRGPGDAEVGVKLHLAEERGNRPQAALLLGTSVPVGDEELTSDRFDPSFRLSLARTLTRRTSLGVNLGMSWASADAATAESGTVTTSQIEITAAFGFDISDRLGAFVEVFGELPASAPGGPRNSLDGGLTFLLHDRLQLDLAAGVGLSEEAPDRFVGFGLSVRWPR